MHSSFRAAVGTTVLLVTAIVVWADMKVFDDFSKPEQFDQWMGETTRRPGETGMLIEFTQIGKSVWTCWSVPDDWEPFESLTLSLESALDAMEIGVAVSDDGEYSVAFPFVLKNGTNTLTVPVKALFENGLQVNYVRGIALWVRANPGAVAVKGVSLVGKGDLSNCSRRGQRMLSDAEERGANFFWSYSYWEGKVTASEEHAIAGKRSFKTKLSSVPATCWGRCLPDWRGYDALVLEAYNPAKVLVVLALSIKDAYVELFSKGYVARKDFVLLRDQAADFAVTSMAPFGLGSTSRNLQGAINRETFEITEMYPAYLNEAKLQSEAEAEQSFRYALSAERIHAKMSAEAKQAVDAGKDLELGTVQICDDCGHTLVGDAPDICPVCQKTKDRYHAFA